MATQEYACEKCGQNFESDSDLARHYEQMHLDMGKDGIA
jgi:hypothetical protein